MTAVFDRREFLQAACLGAASLALPDALSADRSRANKPNVVFILADDLGYGDLSCYGGRDIRTPHIDALAAAGLRFTQAYANSPVCSPTRASLLTGRYPELVGVPGVIRVHANDNWGYLTQDAILLPQLLEPEGYHTAVVGKWHLGLRPENHPLRRGFERFDGFLGGMMDDYYDHRRFGVNYVRRGLKEADPKGHATDIFTRWVVEYIAERAATREPFFLHLAYNAPHHPIQPPKQWLERVQAREKNISEKRAGIVALIEHLDDGVGQVVAALKAHGVYENTLLVFVSDNGGAVWCGASNGPLRSGKGRMYEGGIRVPQIAVWPGRIKPGTITERVMLTMDWFPTLCAAGGARVAHEVDGVDMLPTLLGETRPPESRTLFWVHRKGGAFVGQPAWAARAGDWKLVQETPMSPLELYNLKDDPGEQKDLRKERPEKFRELAEKLRRHMQRGGRVPWQPPAD